MRAGGLADAAIRGIVDSVAFRASAAPYLLLDTDLRIRGANEAYERATAHSMCEMVGEFVFDVFPDNPATPEARSVERLAGSLDRALVFGEPDRMALQRYDVRDPGTGVFVATSWLPSNWPVHDDEGRTAGVLHHAEDVTHLLVATALERHLVAPPAGRWRSGAGTSSLVEALRQDSATRRVRAQLLMDRSLRAVERISRRVDAGEQR